MEIGEGCLVVKVRGLHKLWALRSRVTVPLHHVSYAEVNDRIADEFYKGLRVGTHVPGFITAGYYRDGTWSFWDVSGRPEVAVVYLKDERLSKLVLEVEDPVETVERIRRAKGRHEPS